MNGISLPPALGLNDDGRSFTVDLNLTASLTVQSSLWGPQHHERWCDEIVEERIGSGQTMAAKAPIDQLENVSG